MSLDFLTLDITYHLNDRRVEINGDVREECQSDLITEFLRGEVGAGVDNSPANERERYNISIRWYPHMDRFVVNDNTGNKGLRNGILCDVLRTLSGKQISSSAYDYAI